MNYTPGPWRFQGEKTVSWDGSGSVAFPIYNTSGKFAHVATVMREEDARLIAFAPDLLEALKKHVCVKEVSGDGMNKVDYYPVEESDCELCVVIKKVERK